MSSVLEMNGLLEKYVRLLMEGGESHGLKVHYVMQIQVLDASDQRNHDWIAFDLAGLKIAKNQIESKVAIDLQAARIRMDESKEAESDG